MNKSFTLRILFAALVISVFSSQMHAQVFQKNFSLTGTLPIAYNFNESVQQTDDGGYIFQGWNMSVFPRMELVKTNPDGVVEWKKEYGKCIAAPPLCVSALPGSMSMGGCVQQTTDGGYILSGSLDNNMLLVKTNPTGDVVWAKTYGSSSYGKYVRETSDGGYICVGYSGNNIFIVKTQSNGNLVWDRAYHISPNYNDAATDVDQLLPSGDFIVTGYTTTIFNPGANADTMSDIFLLRLNSSGTLQWTKTYGDDSESEEGQSVRKTSDGGYVVAGHTSNTSHPLSATDVFLWKFNASDAPVFQYSYKVGGFFSLDISFGYAAQETTDGGYALFGVTTGFGLISISYFNNFLLKLDNNGDNVFCKSYKDSISGGVPFNLGWTIWNDGKQLDNGGYIIGGSGIPMSAGTGLGFKLIRTNSIGESGCSEDNVSPIKYTYAPSAEPVTPANLATGSSAVAYLFVSVPAVAEEEVCYVTCTARPGNDTTICEGAGAFQLGMDPAAINGTPPYTYTWTPATDLSDPSVPNPVYTPTTSITYTLSIEDSEGCTSSDDITITILENADATINEPGNQCVYDASVILTAADAGGTWTGTGIVNGTTGEFSPSGVGLGSYWVYYTISGLCGDIDSVYITVTGQLNATITETAPICLNNSPFNLSAVDLNGIWTGQGITNSVLGTFDPDSAGIGTHLITYTISGSCGDSDSTQITVITAPIIDVVLTHESCQDALDGAFSLTITDGTPAFTIKWNDEAIIQVQNTYSLNMLVPGNYLIVVIDSNGCTDTINSTIIESDVLCAHNIYIPNIFSPNDDGFNDILVVRGLDSSEIKEMKFSIYDRWGEKVFESTDILTGWNGEYRNKEMNPAVFVYYFKATLTDEQTIDKKGSVTLVR